MTNVRSIRSTPGRRPGHNRTTSRRRLSWRVRLIIASILLIICLIACGIIGRLVARTNNTSLTHFDAIIVLGSPADRDGNPKPRQLANVTEAVREYERGVAPRLILTGSAVGNQFVEARVMAKTAQAEGIPPSAIFIEPQARDTVQNACYAVQIMKSRGWRSAEVVSAASHLPRAGLVFSRLPIEWRVHAGPSLEPQAVSWAATAVEVVKTARYLTWSRWTESCLPE